MNNRNLLFYAIIAILYLAVPFSSAELIPTDFQASKITINGEDVVDVQLLNPLHSNTFLDCNPTKCIIRLKLTGLKEVGFKGRDEFHGSILKNITSKPARFVALYRYTPVNYTTYLLNETSGLFDIERVEEGVVRSVFEPEFLNLRIDEVRFVDLEFERSFNLNASDDLSFNLFGHEFSQFAWWNASFSYRSLMNITHQNTTVNNIVAPVNLSTVDLISGGYMQSDCNDLRVINNSQNAEFDSDLENATCGTTRTVAWTEFPYLDGGTSNNFFFTYYGSNTTSNSSTNNTYSENNFSVVYHFGETNKSSLATLSNSVSSSFSCTIRENPDANTNITGYWGSAMNFTANTNCTFPVNFTTIMGFDNWTTTFLLNRQGGWGALDTSALLMDSAGNWRISNQDSDSIHFIFSMLGGGTCNVISTTNFNYGEWYAVSIRLANATSSIWVNGVLTGESSCANYMVNTGGVSLILGKRTTSNSVVMTLDEFRINKAPLTDNEINVTHYLLLNGVNYQGEVQDAADEVVVILTNPFNGAYYNGLTGWDSLSITTSTLTGATLYVNYSNGTNYLTSQNESSVGFFNTLYGQINVTDNFTWNVCYQTSDGLNVCQPEWFNVSSDLEPPVVIMTSPNPDNSSVYASAQDILVNFTATDNRSGILSCSYVLNGIPLSPPGCNNFTISGLDPILVNGTNNFSFLVTDQLNNFNYTNLTFVIDAFAPNITIHSPLNGSSWPSFSVLLNTTVTDAESNVSSCWYTLNGGVNSFYNCSLAYITGQSGSNNLTIFANDSVGNLATSGTLFFVVNYTISCNYQYEVISNNGSLVEQNKVLTYINEPLSSINDYILLIWAIGIFAFLGGILPPRALSQGSLDAAKQLEKVGE